MARPEDFTQWMSAVDAKLDRVVKMLTKVLDVEPEASSTRKPHSAPDMTSEYSIVLAAVRSTGMLTQSMETIAEKTGFSLDTVEDQLNEMVQSGLVVRMYNPAADLYTFSITEQAAMQFDQDQL